MPPSSPPPPPLDERFRRALRRLGLLGTGARVLVALSGGRDSVVLLHLLRFHAGPGGPEIAAAHFDHAMRSGSDADARWCAGLCRAWGVPFATARAEVAPRTEEEARLVRYAFLRRAAREAGCTHLATAHHSDDQAETVLFRVLRGTGIAGLAGISAADGTGLVRPLLAFPRGALARWARGHGLRWREDPGNRGGAFARNRIRNTLLPLAERLAAPGARRALVRLARIARDEEAAWDAVLDGAERRVARHEDGAVVLVRSELAGYDSPLALRLLRRVLRRLGSVPGRAGTRRALQFITGAPSGRQMRLPGGVLATAEFGEVRLARLAEDAPAPPADRPATVADAGPGEGEALLGGVACRVQWRAAPWSGPAPDERDPRRAALRLDALRFPLTLRARAPGDRVRTRAGRRPLKKVLAEARIQARRRASLPVLADAEGRVLWAAGAALAADALPRDGEAALVLELLEPVR